MAAIPSIKTLDYTIREDQLPLVHQDYEIKEFLQKGAFGIIFRATHIPTQSKKVIKIATSRSAEDQENERRILEHLGKDRSSPYISYLQDVLDHALVLNHEGEDLASIIERQRSSKTIRYIAWHLFQAIYHLHTQNVVHRDIKLENVMVDQHWRIKIIDLGSASIRGERNVKFTIGTHGYQSPEALISPDKSDSTSDFFSAVILIGYIYLQMLEEKFLLMRSDDDEDSISNIRRTFKEMLYQMQSHPDKSEVMDGMKQDLLKPNPKKPEGYECTLPDHAHITRWQERMQIAGKIRGDTQEEIDHWIALFTPILKFLSERATVDEIMALAKKHLCRPRPALAVIKPQPVKRKLSLDQSDSDGKKLKHSVHD